MERRTPGLTGQVFIVETKPDMKFQVWVDIPAQRVYSLSQYLGKYLDNFFSRPARGLYRISAYEPRRADIQFYDEELATMFKLGHECL